MTGLEFKDGKTLDCELVVIAAGIKPNSELARARGLDRRARHRGRQPDALTDDPQHLRASASACSTADRCTAWSRRIWEQAKVLADHLTGREPDAAYLGSKIATKLKVMGVEVASMGVTEPTEEGDEVVQFTGAKEGNLQEADHPQRAPAREHPAGRHQQGALPDAGVRAQHAAAGGAAVALCSTSARPAEDATIEEMPAEMQVCNCNGVTKGAIVGCVKQGKRSSRRSWRPRAPAWAAARARRSSPRSSSGRAAARPSEDPSADYYVPGVPLTKPELVARDSRARLAVGVCGVQRAGGRSRRSGQQARPGFAAEHALGTTSTSTSATRASSTIACTPTSRRTAPSASFRRCPAASPRPRSCAGSPTWPRSTRCRW